MIDVGQEEKRQFSVKQKGEVDVGISLVPGKQNPFVDLKKDELKCGKLLNYIITIYPFTPTTTWFFDTIVTVLIY